MAYRNKIIFGTPANSGEQLNTSSFSFNHTNEGFSNSRVLVTIGVRDPTSGADTIVSSLTYGGVTQTAVNDIASGGSGAVAIRLVCFLVPNAPVGTNSISVTFAGSISHATGFAVALGNLDLPNAASVDFNTPQTSTASTITQSGTITDERSQLVGVCVVNDGGGTVPNPPTDSTTIVQELGGITNIIYTGSNLFPTLSGNTTTCTHTGGAARASLVIFSFRPYKRRNHAT